MVGRPPINTPEELKEKIESYFGETPKREWTITGIPLYCGYESRQSFYDLEKVPEFSYIIKRARLIVENQYEIKLSGKEVGGAIFVLKNMGWSDKQTIEHEGNPQKPVQFVLDERFKTD